MQFWHILQSPNISRRQLRRNSESWLLDSSVPQHGTRLCAAAVGQVEDCAAGMRRKYDAELTWLANWVRRILRQLMVAIAKEWRDSRSGGLGYVIDARQEMEAASGRYIQGMASR
jgi:hypothetical protein